MRDIMGRTGLLWAALVLICVTAARAADDVEAGDAPPMVDHVRLIAAMPDAVESVLLLRLDRLRSQRFPLADVSEQFALPYLIQVHQQNGEVTLEESVAQAVFHASPIVSVVGGSDFDRPKGIGATEFDARYIWVTGKSIDEYRQRLMNGEGISCELVQHDVGGHPVVAAEVNRPSQSRGEVSYTAYVAVVGDHTIAMARSREELASMIDRLTVNADAGGEVPASAELPARWVDAAADLDVQKSPIVLFREYDPETSDTFSPAHSLIREQLGITAPRSLALVLSDLETMTWTARLAGAKLVHEGQPPPVTLEDVSNLLGSFGQTVEALEDDDGLRGRLRPVEGDHKQKTRALALFGLLYHAFGAPFYI